MIRRSTAVAALALGLAYIGAALLLIDPASGLLQQRLELGETQSRALVSVALVFLPVVLFVFLGLWLLRRGLFE